MTTASMTDNFNRFMEMYERNLGECVRLALLPYPYSEVPAVAERMRQAIPRNAANYDGPAFKMTCRFFRIKNTRKAVHAFLFGTATAPRGA